MPGTRTAKGAKAGAQQDDAFELKAEKAPTPEVESRVHLLAKGIVCDTEPRGHKTARGRTPFEIVVDASEGFVPLWARNTTLRWRFRDRSMSHFAKPAAAKAAIRNLFAEALLDWEDAAPVRFTEDDDVWDFEIVMRRADDCSASGCVLASAFFPDSGRHKLVLYPQMFEQSHEERVETFIHEIGHIFGLRHFFAAVQESAWPSHIFGTHSKFSIMNYGTLSRLTDADRNDLKRLYQLAWTGALKQINGTPIRLVKPFNTLAHIPESLVAFRDGDTTLQPAAIAATVAPL